MQGIQLYSHGHHRYHHYMKNELVGMIFEYRSMCGTGNTASVPGFGTVIMATEYDCYDPIYENKRDMEAAEFSSNGVPYDRIFHAVECDPRRNVLRTNYVVPGLTTAATAVGDERMSVLGNFTIATQGQQAAGVVMGELWVHYKMRLSRPILEATGVNLFSQHVSGTISTGGTVIQSNIITQGGTGFDIAFNNISVSNTSVTIKNVTNQLTGRFQIVVNGYNPASGFATTAGTYGITSGSTTANIPLLLNNDSFAALTNSNPTTGNFSTYTAIVNILTPGYVQLVPIYASSATVCSFDIFITPMNSTLTSRRGRNSVVDAEMRGLKIKETMDINDLKKQISLIQNNNSNSSKNEIDELKSQMLEMKKLLDLPDGIPILRRQNKICPIIESDEKGEIIARVNCDDEEESGDDVDEEEYAEFLKYKASKNKLSSFITKS